jgi:hypothetical protein
VTTASRKVIEHIYMRSEIFTAVRMMMIMMMIIIIIIIIILIITFFKMLVPYGLVDKC